MNINAEKRKNLIVPAITWADPVIVCILLPSIDCRQHDAAVRNIVKVMIIKPMTINILAIFHGNGYTELTVVKPSKSNVPQLNANLFISTQLIDRLLKVQKNETNKKMVSFNGEQLIVL